MRGIRHLKIIIIIILVVQIFFINSSIYANSVGVPPEISAEAAIIIDLDRGQVLFEKYADRQFAGPMISKLMTILIAAENYIPQTGMTITASINAAETPGRDNINLIAGNIYKTEDIISTAIMTLSENMCTALYESIEPDPDKFVEIMNTKSESLAITNTLFSTPCGKIDEICYTTPRDIATFMQHALNIAFFNEVFSSRVRFVDNGLKPSGLIENDNDLFKRYDGMKGGTAIFFDDGKVSTITCVEKNNMKILSVLLYESKNKYISENIELFDYCFDTYERIMLAEKGKRVMDIEVGDETLHLIASNDIYYITKKGEDSIVEYEHLLIEDITAPVMAGTHAGTIRYTLEDGTKILVSLQAENNIYSSKITMEEIIEKISSNKDVLQLVYILLILEGLLIIYYGTKFIVKKLQ